MNELDLEVRKLNKSKEVIEPCQKYELLTQKVDSLEGNVSKLQEEALSFSNFKKSSSILDDMLCHQNLSQDKEGLGFSKAKKTTFESRTKPIMFVKESQNGDLSNAHFKPIVPQTRSANIREVIESSSRNVDTLNMHTFYQRHHSDYHWTKDYPLEQVRGNPSKPVQTRRQLSTYPKMCMFALVMSTAEPTNIKEAMDDHAWIESMQEELHQFGRLKVWELVDKPFGKTVIKLKWLWKNKKDEDNTIIRNKARLVAKGYA
ncbi:hypothetical protein Tco_0724961 [Tanacetum coccineum]|uniref:Gag-Pol polyprotein n=1 Tax=Tanacetum coccineum TaxID=301880 RepID=A0ABQ4YCD0_9ASTR